MTDPDALLQLRSQGSGPATPEAWQQQDRVLRELWRSFGAHRHAPTWSSGLVDAAVRWAQDAGVEGLRRLWMAWFVLLRDVEPNILHWNLMDQLWISAAQTPLGRDLARRPPSELSGPLSTGQALLVLRFMPLDGDLGQRLRDQLEGFTLAEEVDGRTFSTRPWRPRRRPARPAAYAPPP